MKLNISRASPIANVGRQTLRVSREVVLVSGTVLVYGNDISILEMETGNVFGVLAQELPRWWRIDAPQLQYRLLFGTPGYVSPIDGRVLEGGLLVTDLSLNRFVVPIACSHPFSIWRMSGVTASSTSFVPANLLPVAASSRLVMSNDPVEYQESMIKLQTTQMLFNGYIVGLGAFDSMSAAVIIAGRYTPSNVFIPSSFPPGPIASGIRNQVYVFVRNRRANTTNIWDFYFIGDIAQYAPWDGEYQFKMSFGSSLYPQPFYVAGEWAWGLFTPNTEEPSTDGAALFRYSNIELNLRRVIQQAGDVALPMNYRSGNVPGSGNPGFQGEAADTRFIA